MTPRIINGPQVAAQLSAAIKDIARLTGFSERDVTRGEAGAILRTWAGRVGHRSPDKVLLTNRLRVLKVLGLTSADNNKAGVTINAGVRGVAGLVYWRAKNNRQFLPAGVVNPETGQFNRFKMRFSKKITDMIDAKQEDFRVIEAKTRNLALASRGLAQQSIMQMGDSVGIRLENVPATATGISATDIARARRAVASNGQTYSNGSGSEQMSSAGKYFLTLVNRLPYGSSSKLDLPGKLAWTIAGRVGLYKRNFAGAAFQSIQQAARNYPWMKLQTGYFSQAHPGLLQ